MARMVQCVKLGREAEGLDRSQYPGELGQRIFETVSKEEWQKWLGHQTMLVNEYRLDLLSEARRGERKIGAALGVGDLIDGELLERERGQLELLGTDLLFHDGW